MRVSWKIARIFGIDICIDASWLVIFGLFTWIMASYYFPSGYPQWPRWQYWVVGALTSILFFASVLGHELAHSLVAIRQGEKVRRITLFILGGVAQISEEPKEASKEFFMALVGPMLDKDGAFELNVQRLYSNRLWEACSTGGAVHQREKRSAEEVHP